MWERRDYVRDPQFSLKTMGMDKNVAKKLRKHFQEQLAKRLPQYRPASDPRVLRGSRLFEWKMKDGLCVYLQLCISPKLPSQDLFTIDVAWSTKCRFPQPRGPMFPFPVERSHIKADPPVDGEYYTRIGLLAPPYQDHWWAVTNREEEHKLLSDDDYFEKWVLGSPSIIDYVEDRVKDAIDRIIRDVVPYFESVANSYVP
jgi:hypothetical protein